MIISNNYPDLNVKQMTIIHPMRQQVMIQMVKMMMTMMMKNFSMKNVKVLIRIAIIRDEHFQMTILMKVYPHLRHQQQRRARIDQHHHHHHRK